MRELYGPPGHVKHNLNESVLLDFLTLFHVATPAQMIAKYENIGPLDHIVFAIISQFVPTRIVNEYGPIPTGNHASELNVVNLSCVVVAKPYTREAYIPHPVMAYLSSDVLDQCVRSVGHFPTMEQYMNTRMIEKAAAFLAPPPPPPPASAPPLDVLDGGKKTRRKANKKRKHSKKNRHH